MTESVRPSCEESPPEEGEVTSPPPVEDQQDLIVLEPARLHFRREGGRLQVRKEGEEEWREVSVARLFPLSDAERWISVLDKEGKEVGVLLDLRELSRENLDCLREELHRRYLVPNILRILACRDRYDLVEWVVETDRGGATFLTRHLREKVQEPLPHHLTLTDMEGNRYDIPDVEALDPDSRRWLDERI